MSTLPTILHGGIGLWLGLLPGCVIGFIITARRDERARQRLAAELAINADLRAQLADARRRLLFYGRDTADRSTATRQIHGQPWTAKALDRAAAEAAQVQL